MLKRIVSLTLAVAFGLAASISSSAGFSSFRDNPGDTTLYRTVREVQLGFVVLQDGRAIANPQKEQFTIYQDEQPITAITGFYAKNEVPTQLFLMMDTSASMGGEFQTEKAAALAFLSRVVRPGIDASAVATFSTHASLNLAAGDGSPEELRRIAMLRPAGLTALFDSICEIAEQFTPINGRTRATRNTLILFSDGDDTYSRHSMDDATAAAQNAGLVIYAITTHRRKQVFWGEKNLERLTAATGGRVFFLKNFEHSDIALAELEREIQTQVTVTFRPIDNSCGFHRLRAEPVNHRLEIRSRAGFFGDCP